MPMHHILVDFENVPVKSLEKLAGLDVRVKVFLGKNNNKLGTDLVMAMQALGDKAGYIRLTSTGPNALDFHIACYLGRILAQEPNARCTVISKDKGFDALIAHLKGEGNAVERCASIDAIPGFKGSTPAKKLRTAATPVAAKATAPAAVRSARAPKLPVEAKAPTISSETKARRRRATADAAPDANLDLAIAFLMTRRKSLPAKMKALMGTLQARFGKDAPAGEAERVCQLLIARGYAKETKGKLSFNLPDAT